MQMQEPTSESCPIRLIEDNPFGGAQTSSERSLGCCKRFISFEMSSSELEVSYNTKGRLQVKMFGAGKTTYNLDDNRKSLWPRADKLKASQKKYKTLWRSKSEIQREISKT